MSFTTQLISALPHNKLEKITLKDDVVDQNKVVQRFLEQSRMYFELHDVEHACSLDQIARLQICSGYQ